MGISGLLPFLKNSSRPANVKEFCGSTVAIDAYSWLHKGAFSCAEKLVKGEKTDGYVHYCMKKLNMLLAAGVKPIMVFDGCNLPSKSVTEKKRRENREKTRQKGKEYLCQGKIREARECFQRCVDVTPEMAFEVIQVCKKKGIKFIVAPYEADSQLAYLNKIGIAQIIITEDSDLVLFGCEKILFKMDSCGGGILYEKKHLSKSFGANAEKMSFEKFLYTCILSGCDYLPSLPGIGLAKAYKFFKLTTNNDVKSVLTKLPSYLNMPTLVVSIEYRESFMQAIDTFLYQLVYCPQKKMLVPLNTYPEGRDYSDMEYAGKYYPPEVAQQIASGSINVKTMKRFEHLSCCEDTYIDNRWTSSLSNECQSSHVENITKTLPFKFKTCSPQIQSVYFGKKRDVDQIGEENAAEILENEELFSTYCSSESPAKRSKSDEFYSPDAEGERLESEKSKREEYSRPFRKPPLSSALNVDNTESRLENIVRSRFFVKTEHDARPPKRNPVNESSWLESIDQEYEANSMNLSVTFPGRVCEILNGKSDESTCKKQSRYESYPNKIISHPFIKINKENIDEYSSKSRHFGFKWSGEEQVSLNRNNVLDSIGNSFDESYVSGEDNSVSPKLLCSSEINSSKHNSDCDKSCRNFEKDELDVMEIENGATKDEAAVSQNDPNSTSCIQQNGFSRSHYEKDLKSPEPIKYAGKAKRCRSIGLSKKPRSKPVSKILPGKVLNIKDTLLHFKFVKQPKIT